jgi:uncharacterized protein (TIGR03437 family)
MTVSAAPLRATSFGTVVAIGGPASDIVLDESRGVLYIADFGNNTIDVMSLSDNTVHSSINVPPQPGAMAMSPDSQYLVIVHYGNYTSGATGNNLISVIHLADNTRQTFNTGDPPLGVSFVNNGGSGQALVVTTTGFLMFDPVSGQMAVVGTFANLAKSLPVNEATFPGQILETAMAASADGQVIWGIGGGGTGTQVIYQYYARTNSLAVTTDVSQPPLLPRVSVAADGSYAMVGWSLLQGSYIKGRYPNVLASPNITGHAIDSTKGIIYGQFPDASQPVGPPAAAAAGAVIMPSLLLMAADNLTILDRITIPENMVGHAVLSSDGSMLYAVSDSGVMVLPVGSLNQYPRVQAAQEDVFVQSNFCNRNAVTQTLTIADPGGNHTDFSIGASAPGVTIVPSSGVTPATVQVQVNPNLFPSSSGTTAVTLTISSQTAVNQPRPVRLLVNNPDVNQRGTVIDIPGALTDILPDPARNRYYVLRADKNQLLVFDGGSNQLLTTLRTATTPDMMAMTNDQSELLVGHNDSQLVMVYDLNALAPLAPVVLPGGHYARSLASSNGATLALVRDEASGGGAVDGISVASGFGTKLPALGVYANSVSPMGVLTGTPNGANILLASPDGNVMLYSAQANTFTTSRQDFTSLSGAFAGSSYGQYVVGGNVFNSSLVPVGTLNVSGGSASGFTFSGPGGYLVTAASAGGPGVIQNMPTLTSNAVRPVSIVEAPLLPTAAATTSTGSAGNASAGAAAGAIGGSGSSGSSGSGSTSAYALTSFSRTVAPMPSAGTVVVLSTSGVTVLAANYDAAVAAPQIASVVNAGDGTQPVAPGGLISVYGSQMSPVNMATSQIPLPTALGDSCLSVNGAPVPLLFVSSQQINAQLPFNVGGNATLTIHTPGGISNNYLFSVQPAAPSVFQTGTAGPLTGLATVVRADNNQLITPTNPIHPKDTVVIYLTGMGSTVPAVDAGMPAPSSPLASAAITPSVTLGGSAMTVLYAGLVPGEVGVYQINATAPDTLTQGLSIPLVINQGGAATTLNVRVVTP